MTEIDIKQRRANWPGIEASLRAHDYVYVLPKDKPTMKKYYIEGAEPDLFLGEIGLIARLMCEPQSTEADWKRWKSEHSMNALGGAMRAFMNLQENKSVYMGNNSPFGGREAEIYEYFFADLMKPFKRQITEVDIYVLAKRTLPQYIYDIGAVKLATYTQAFRAVDYYVRGVEEWTHPLDPNVNVEDHRTYAKVFCPIAFVYKNPKNFDQRLKDPIRKLYQFLLDPDVSPLLRDTFNVAVKRSLDQYAEETGAGGVVSACFQYRSRALLEAVLPVLSPDTRYPHSVDTPEDRVVGLPTASVGDRQNRTSFRSISYLWQSGFIADRVVQIDDKTLFVQFKAPMCVGYLQNTLHALRQDLTDLEARIKAGKPLAKDAAKRKQYAKCVYTVEPLVGRSMIGASISGGNTEFVQIFRGLDSEIDKYFTRKKAMEDVLLDLLESEYSRIQDKGTSCHGYWL